MLRSLQVQDSGENHDDTFAHAMTASKICMASALGVTQCLSALVQPVEYIDVTLRSSLSFSPRPLPYFACCAMQSAYTLLVLLYTLQGALASGNCEKYRDILSSTEPGLESVEIERLVHELRHGICDLLHVMDHSFPIFEGVAAMLEEVRSAYDIDDYKGVFGMGN
ncbi:hypothetical protein BDV59DRAFT_167237 [Aspergillus ambiguus]|uniref:uncharacterized protein n=1 Tax=Aspergillus ambiguus TaxID=176160 RepID=UPI003CCDC774